MADMRIDELNTLTSTDEAFDYEDYIEHYFDPMQISEKQRQERIEAAMELFDIILYFLMWCLEFPEQVQTEEVKHQFENDYKERVFQYGEPDSYINKYVPLFINNLIDTTLSHEGEDYFTSIERATIIACNEANTIKNYTDIQAAKEQGFAYKRWDAQLDERTRLDHIEMDGTVIPIDDYFIFGDCAMFMAHDEVNGTARQCANCRCSTSYLRSHISGGLSGAYNDDNDPLYEKRDSKGKELYSEIKNRKKQYEIEAVARHSGYSVEEIGRVYEHVFIREHLFEDGSIRQFDPDYYMANSWLRIRNNDNIQEHDLMMLKHELEEEKIMGKSLEIPYEMAHNEVEIMGYSYQKLLDKYLETHDV